MIENIHDSVSTKIEKTPHNLSEALDLKFSQIDLKRDTITSKNDDIERNIHHLMKPIDELKTEHEMLENKVNYIQTETVNLHNERFFAQQHEELGRAKE